MKRLLFILILLITSFLSVGQPLFIKDNAVITMKSGAYLIVNPAVADAYQAIKLTGTGTGYIVCEEEINKVVWWLRDGANTNDITVPFANASGVSVKIKMVNIAAGSSDGAMVFSTAPTTPNNRLISTGAYPSNVTNMFTNGSNADNSLNTADRFWFVEYYNYTNKPLCQDGFTFYYADADITGLTENNLLAQYWNSGWVMPVSGILWDLNNDCATITDPRISAPWVLVSKNITLPVELISLNASCNDGLVQLSWSTASETNNDYFTVERSSDAVNWANIAQIEGSGNSNQVLNYFYTDEIYSDETTYYRLKQTDFDGTSEYFDPVSVQCGEGTNYEISIHPNPTNDYVFIEIKNFNHPDAQIAIYDMLGKKIEFQNITSVEDAKMKTTFDLKGYASGMYFIEIKADDFNENYKIIKK